MKRSILALLLCICLLVPLFCGNVCAAEDNPVKRAQRPSSFPLSLPKTDPMGVLGDGAIYIRGNGQVLMDNTVVTSNGADLAGPYCLKTDGTVIHVPTGKKVSGFTKIASIAYSYLGLAGVRTDGTVVFDRNGGKDTATAAAISKWTNIVGVAVGGEQIVGLKANGTVVLFSTDTDMWDSRQVAGWKNVVQVAASDKYTFGLKDDGTVLVAAGSGTDPKEYQALSGWKDIVSISAFDYLLAVTKDGDVRSFPYRDINCFLYYPQLWKNVYSLKVTGNGNAFGIRADGTGISMGNVQTCGLPGLCTFGFETPMHWDGKIENGFYSCSACGLSAKIPAYVSGGEKNCNHRFAANWHSNTDVYPDRAYAWCNTYEVVCLKCGLKETAACSPVYKLKKLRDTNPSNSDCDIKSGTWTDMSKAKYPQSLRFWVNGKSGYSPTESVEYDLGGNRYQLIGYLGVESHSNSGGAVEFRIYLDDKLVVTKNSADWTYEPGAWVCIDLAGAKKLRIECSTKNSFDMYGLAALQVYTVSQSR